MRYVQYKKLPSYFRTKNDSSPYKFLLNNKIVMKHRNPIYQYFRKQNTFVFIAKKSFAI